LHDTRFIKVAGEPIFEWEAQTQDFVPPHVE
jgi:hypothetical protein